MKKRLLAVIASSLLCASVYAADLAPLKSDTEQDRTDWSTLDSRYGAMPKVDKSLKIGGVSKTLTNEYWRLLGEGYQNAAKNMASPLLIRPRQMKTINWASCRLPKP